MMFERYKELIGGVLFLVLAIAYYFASLSIRIVASVSATVSAQTVPHILAMLIGILSIIQIVRGVKAARDYQEKEGVEPPFTKRVCLTILVIILYIASMNALGFLISTAMYLFLQILILMPPHKIIRKNIIFSAVLSCIFSLAVYVIFVYGLTLMLPEGILG